MTNTFKVMFHFHCQVMDVQTSDLHKNNINLIHRHIDTMHTSKRYEMFLQHKLYRNKLKFVNNLAQVSLSPLPLFLS